MQLKIVIAFVVAMCLSLANARMYILDDGAAPFRYRRQAPEPAAPQARPQRRQGAAPTFAADADVSASNVYAAPRGRVGPVYTFVKTDPNANFKWGVRHVAGVQYGRR